MTRSHDDTVRQEANAVTFPISHIQRFRRNRGIRAIRCLPDGNQSLRPPTSHHDRSRNLIYSWSFKTGITNNNNNNNDDTHNTRKHNNIEFKHARRPGGHGPGWSLHRGGMFRQPTRSVIVPPGWTGSPDVIRSSYANPVWKWSFSNECKTSAGCRN